MVLIDISKLYADSFEYTICIEREYVFSGSSFQKIELMWDDFPQVKANELSLLPPQSTNVYSDSIVYFCGENKLILCNTYKTGFSFIDPFKISKEYVVIQKRSDFPETIQVRISLNSEEKTISLASSIIRSIYLILIQMVGYIISIWMIIKLILYIIR